MSFNTPTFAVQGMMPTTHPVAESRSVTAFNGSLDFVFSETVTAPSSVEFVLTDYTGRRFFTDTNGDKFVRVGTQNKFVFGSEEDGYIPVGTCWLWVNADATVTKYCIVSQDTPWTTADNTGFGPPPDA